jgi:uncharacterized protein YihD (DUF1040 family)
MQFVLVPDAQAGFSVRKQLASETLTNVSVGTFSALIDLVKEAWLLPSTDLNNDDKFQQAFNDALPKVADAFWQQSYQIDDINTATVIEQNLRYILEALPLGEDLRAITDSESRITQYYNDFVTLFDVMDKTRPSQQEVASKWFELHQQAPLFNIEVISLIDISLFTPWQQQVLSTLQSLEKPQSAENKALRTKLEAMLNEKKQSSMNTLAKRLFTDNVSDELSLESSLAITRCRDSYQETEFVVAKIQKMIFDDHIDANSIAVMLPNNEHWQQLVPKMLNQAGIATSNFLASNSQYQWDFQLIKECLTLYVNILSDQVIAPMQYAAIVTNPLMPWSQSKGQQLAEKIFAGKLESLLEQEGCSQVISLLLTPTSIAVSDWLNQLIELLQFPRDVRVISKSRLQTLIAQQQLELVGQNKEDVVNLGFVINRFNPSNVSIDNDQPKYQKNSLLLLSENDVLYHQVEQLFVIGFNQDNYEFNTTLSSLFNAENWQELSKQSGLNLTHYLVKQDLKQAGFKQSLANVSDKLIITLSSLDLEGRTVNVSETLTDIAVCVQAQGKVEPEALISNVDTEILSALNQLSTGEELKFNLPKQLNLGQDLLASNLDSEGNHRPESPSSLSQMMVSPFAWWLNRNYLTLKDWPVEELTIMLKGTLAHKVFELFFKGKYQDVNGVFGQLFERAISEDAPFLATPRWRLERSQLKAEIHQSLVPFVQWCQVEQWQCIATEENLSGELFGLRVRGEADAIFSTPEQTLILDYKTSKSTGRIKPLESGYEVQTKIYRELYSQMDGIEQTKINSGYLTLKDSTLLCHQAINTIGCDDSLLNIAELNQYGNAQSANSEALIADRINQLHQGVIELNSVLDQSDWDKRGHKLEYAFEQYPLVKLFLCAAAEVEEGESNE